MRRFERGFTLVEMLIVIGIILIIFSFGYAMYKKQKMKSHFLQVDVASQAYAKALRQCFELHHEWKKCTDGYGHANDPNVLRAWAGIKALENDGKTGQIMYWENQKGAGWVRIRWNIPVIIPGKKDSSGNPVTSLYGGDFWRNRRSGKMEIHVPRASSDCVQDGYCKPSVTFIGK